MKRIWLNHWFSTAYFIINMMRENNPEFQFIASNENQDSPIMKASDEWYQEPVLRNNLSKLVRKLWLTTILMFPC